MNYQELLFSQTALDNDINNQPQSIQVIRNLQQLQDFLTSLETLLGVEIYINSGYRCFELNEIVKGAKNSYHLYGLAADIRVDNTARCTLSDFKELMRTLRHTRLNEVIVHDTYVHIAIKPYY